MYVEDAAEAIVLTTEKYDKPEPLNIGAGFEIKIKDLVSLVVELTGFRGEIVWDGTKPDEQTIRRLGVSRAEKEVEFKAKKDFREGFRKTIKWYRGVRKGDIGQ